MKKIILTLFVALTATAAFNSCSRSAKTSESEEEDTTYRISAKDSARIVEMAQDFMEMMKADKYNEVADDLYYLNLTDTTVTELTEQQRIDFEFRKQIFPVKDYSLYSVEFIDPLDNAVTFDVVFGEPDADGNAPMTKMSFNIVNIDGTYYPTLREKHM